MPRIQPLSVATPTHTAPLRHIVRGSEDIEAFEELGRVGAHLQDIQNRIRETNDEFTFLRAAAEYDAEVDSIVDVLRKKIVTHHSDIAEQLARVRQGAKEAFDRFSEPLSAAARAKLTRHVAKTGPAILNKVHANALKSWGSSVLMQLDDTMESMSEAAAQRGADTDFAEHTRLAVKTALANALARGFINAEEFGKRLRTFEEKIGRKNMQYLLNAGETADERKRNRMILRENERRGMYNLVDPAFRVKVLEESRLLDERDERRAEAAFRTAKQTYLDHVAALANFGAWPDSNAEEAMAGNLYPLITADEARRYWEINQNPPSGEGSLQARWIAQKYHLSDGTLTDLQQARAELRHLEKSLTRPNKHVDQLANELQADERALRGIAAAELNAGLQYSKDEYEARIGKLIPPTAAMIGTLWRMEQVRRQHDLAEIRNRLRKLAQQKGQITTEDATKVVDEIIGRRAVPTSEAPHGVHTLSPAVHDWLWLQRVK